jgi:hypothetical protein
VIKQEGSAIMPEWLTDQLFAGTRVLERSVEARSSFFEKKEPKKLSASSFQAARDAPLRPASAS